MVSCPNCGTVEVYDYSGDWYADDYLGYGSISEIKFCPFCGFELPEIPKPKEVSQQEFMDIQLAKSISRQILEKTKPLKFRKFCDA